MLPLAVATYPAGAQVREGRFRIGVLVTSTEGAQELVTVFIQELARLGYVEGANATLLVRSAEGRLERLPALAGELVSLKPDIVLAAATPHTAAMKNATTVIPIVFGSVSNPVRSGFVSSLAHPGGNITGVTLSNDELAPKRLQLIKELIPEATRVAMFRNALSEASVDAIADTTRIASRFGIEITLLDLRSSDDVALAVAQAAQLSVHALISTPDVLGYTNRRTIIAVAREHRLPVMYNYPIEVREGGLISYGADITEAFRRAAVYVDKILRGARPADLPVEQPTTLHLTVNLETASKLGITIPPSLLARADEVIE